MIDKCFEWHVIEIITENRHSTLGDILEALDDSNGNVPHIVKDILSIIYLT